MYYLYLLHSSKNKEFYVGTTSDLKKRFYSHNQAKNIATKSGVPWRIVYYEAYSTKDDALRREQSLKYYGQGLRRLKERITLVDRT
ncbi:GIY-YIG nuclease family protein [Candidatus Saccharibacteria bacterium]|nr:GIY-YIG nuclease family protein [Candidatus Saccharibacteria bacterium]